MLQIYWFNYYNFEMMCIDVFVKKIFLSNVYILLKNLNLKCSTLANILFKSIVVFCIY